MLRWLMGWDYDIDVIVPKVEKTIDVLVNLGLNNQNFGTTEEINSYIRNLHTAADYFPGEIMGQDLDGNMIYMQTLAKTHPRTLVKAGSVSALFQVLISETELAMKIIRSLERETKQKLGVKMILDLDGFSMDLLYTPTLKIYLSLLSALQEHFPDFEKKIYVVNSPMMIHSVNSMISPVLAKQTRDKEVRRSSSDAISHTFAILNLTDWILKWDRYIFDKNMAEFKLQLEPAERIVFSGKKLGEENAVTNIKIKNPTKDRVAYKVKCTSNDIFRIRPPVGALKGEETATVALQLNAGKAVPESGKHYFAIYYIKAEDEKKPPRACWADHKGDPEGTKRMFVDFKKEGEEDEKKDDKKEDKKDDKKEDEKKEDKDDDKEEKKDEKDEKKDKE